ncbi:unnamed protein product [Auanema sp. JU1783]|nr:unnamed protein product [Auanema sp. JU1783]
MISFTDDIRYILLSIVILLIAIFGVIMNSLSIFVVLKNPLLKSSFGILCFSHSVANIGVLSVFLVWVAPITVIDDDHLWRTRFAKHLGQLNILFWDACVYSHLAISVNRFFTITFPHSQTLINSNATIILASLVWTCAIFHIIPYFWVDQCFILYDPKTVTWNFADTKCGFYISTYFDYYTGCAVFIVIAILDLFTLITLRIKNNHMHSLGTRAHQRRQVELRFFIQACVQASLFFYELVNFYFVSTLNSSFFYVYFTSTFAWEICHAMDGLVLFLFQYKAAFPKKARVTTTVTASIQSHHKSAASIVVNTGHRHDNA